MRPTNSIASTNRTRILDRMLGCRVSAIIRTADQNVARDAIKAVVAGGFRMVEFTLTTPGAVDLIAEFSENRDLIVGAGTVLTIESARESVAKGAAYLVSPVCDPAVVAEAARLDVPSMPGTFTPTEMMTAHRCGADLVKLFPAPAADVAGYVTAVLGPLPFLRIFPTAGVDADNFVKVLHAGAAGIGFVRSLFDPHDLASKNFAAIERRASTIIHRLREWESSHALGLS